MNSCGLMVVLLAVVMLDSYVSARIRNEDLFKIECPRVYHSDCLLDEDCACGDFTGVICNYLNICTTKRQWMDFSLRIPQIPCYVELFKRSCVDQSDCMCPAKPMKCEQNECVYVRDIQAD